MACGFPFNGSGPCGYRSPHFPLCPRPFERADFFAALVGAVSLATYLGYLSLPCTRVRPLWSPRALRPFIIAALFETTGFLLLTIGLSVGQVVFVTPIVATSPMWVVLWMTLVARDLERVHYRTILGTCLVVTGTVAISFSG